MKFPAWVERWYLKRQLRKTVNRALKAMTKEEKMQIWDSKEQWSNIINVVASTLALVNNEAIVGWLGQAGEAAASGRLEVVLAAAVSGLLGVSRFFSRLNRQKEVAEAAS